MSSVALNQPAWLTQVRRGAAWLSRHMALVGGLIMLGLATMSVVSITGRALFGMAISGDYELVEAGLGISVFLFLPECYRQKGHVVVDVFTNNLAPRKLAFLEMIGDILFLVASAVMTWRLFDGAVDARNYMEQSMILELPLWIVYAVGVFSSAVVALSAVDNIVIFFTGAHDE